MKTPLKCIDDGIYVAGALSGTEMEYIANLTRMVDLGEDVRRLGAVPLVPGNDFLSCFLNGNLTYKDVIKSSLRLLAGADAMIVGPKSSKSNGVDGEVQYALTHNIPIFYDTFTLERWLNRPKILAIVGESGSGKTWSAEYLMDELHIPLIESHTDRPKRTPDETGHTFHTKDEFDNLPPNQMIAYTEWEGNRYCCLHQDVKRENTYVMDEYGLLMMRHKFNTRYNIRSLRIHRDEDIRRNAVGDERVNRDEGKFFLYDSSYDFVVNNNGSYAELAHKLEKIARHFFRVEV